MNLTDAKTIDLINELARRKGVVRTVGKQADLILTIPSLDDVTDDAKTFEFTLNNTIEEVISLTEIIMDHIRDGWKRVDHWTIGDDLVVVLSPPEKSEDS